MKYLLLLAMLFSSFGYSHNIDSSELKNEVKQLRIDIKRLEQRIIDLQLSLSNDSTHSGSKATWGCYIDDITAGGIYSNARTEAEAKGKALHKCNLKNGACWENKVKCSVSD